MRVRGRRDSASVARTCKSREESALAHTVAMGAALGAHERDPHRGRGALLEGDDDLDSLAIGPILIRDGEGGRGQAGEGVGGREDFAAVFLGVHAVLGIGAGDHDAAVLHENGFGMVKARDGGVGHDAEAGVDGLAGVVEDGVEVGARGETEASSTLMGAVEDQEGAVWEGGHAAHDTLGWHALDDPLRVGDFGLYGNAIVDGDSGTRHRATTDHDSQGGAVRRTEGHDDRGSFEGICTSSFGMANARGNAWKHLFGQEGYLVQDLRLVVVGYENAARWQDRKEGIETVRIRLCKERARDKPSAGRW